MPGNFKEVRGNSSEQQCTQSGPVESEGASFKNQIAPLHDCADWRKGPRPVGFGKLINYDPVNCAARLCNFIEFSGSFVTNTRACSIPA